MMTNLSTAPILIVFSYHHLNTRKIAEVLAEELGARILRPQDVDPAELFGCRLIGFGSGIYNAEHHAGLLRLAERLPEVNGNAAFIFSTSGIYTRRKAANDHEVLRNILQGRGYKIAGEFGCRGWDTYSILKYIGGLNKGRPNDHDFERARAFARKLQQPIGEEHR